MKTLVLNLLVAGVLLPGCGDDAILPPPPDEGGVPLTLDNAWPNEDGRFWEYASLEQVWSTQFVDSAFVYPDSQSVPAAPGLATLLNWLDDSRVPDPGSVTESHYRLRFDGEVQTPFGHTTQNLLEEWAPFTDPPLEPFEVRFAAQLRFIRSGFQLREGIHGLLDHVRLDPVVLHGGAWEKTGAAIGTYNDVDPGLGWKFLDSKLEPGDSFVHTTSFGTTVRGWVRGRAKIETGVGSFENALVCVYLLDTGVSCTTTVFAPQGIGCYRLFFYGRIFYVPTVGPVFAYERHLAAAGDPDGEGWGDITLSLTGVRAGTR